MKTMAVVIITLCFILLVCSMTCCQEMGGGSSSAMSEQREAFGIGIRQEPSAKATTTSVEQANTPNSAASIDVAKTDTDSDAADKLRTESSGEMNIAVREVNRFHNSKSHSSRSDSKATVSRSNADESTAKTDGNEVITSKSKRPDKISVMEGAASVDKPKDKSPKSTAVTVLGMIWKLVLVCGLSYLVLLFLKTVYNKQESKPRASREVKLVDTVRLTPGSTVHVINVQGKKLLIGCSANQVNLIQELEADQVAEAPAETSKRFAEYMQQYSAGSKTDNPTQRIAGLLRDCSAYLRKRYPSAVPAGRGGESNEK